MHPGTPTCSWDEGVGARQQLGPHTDDLTTWDVWENSGVRSGEHSRGKTTQSVWEGSSLSVRMGDSESSDRQRPGAEYRLRGTESSLGSGRRSHKAELHVRNVDSVLWVVANRQGNKMTVLARKALLYHPARSLSPQHPRAPSPPTTFPH